MRAKERGRGKQKKIDSEDKKIKVRESTVIYLVITLKKKKNL